MSFFFTQNTLNYGKREATLFLLTQNAQNLGNGRLFAPTCFVSLSKTKQSRE